MNIKLKLKIYWKLLLLFLSLSLLPLLVLEVISYHNTRHTIKEYVGNRLEYLALSAINQVDHQLADHFQDIQHLARLPIMQDVQIKDANGRINDSLINFYKGHDLYFDISCLNSEGKVIASTNPQLKDEILAGSQSLQGVMSGQDYVSDVLRMQSGSGTGLRFAVPIYAAKADERIIGLLTGVFDMNHIQQMLEKIKIDTGQEQFKGAHIMLVDQKGLVISAPRFEAQAILRDNLFDKGILPPDVRQSNKTGYLIAKDEHNQLSFIGFARSGSHGVFPGSGWTVLTIDNTENAFAPLYKLRNLIRFSFVILALLIIGASHLFARRITKPISKLSQTVRRITREAVDVNQGENENIASRARDEIGELTELFDFMVVELNRAKKKLEEKQLGLEITNESLNYIIDEIHKLIEHAVNEESFEVRFQNPDLVKCWEVLGCDNLQCPAYESEDQRCWHVAGTLCKGEVQGTFAKKLGDCRKCGVYQQAITTKLYTIGEVFNNLMELLQEKNREVKDYAQNLESKVRKRTAELERSNEELQQTHKQLLQADKLAALGQLAAGISHELNSPLWGILSYSQHILEQLKAKEEQEGISPEEFRSIFKYMGYIERESQRCKTIVSNLLKFARTPEADMKILDINQVVKDTLNFTSHQIKIGRVKLIKKLFPDLPQVKGNEHQLQQVFTDIIVNALQAMQEGGKLFVSTALDNMESTGKSFVLVSFEDTGCGIPKENMDKLFDPFFTTKEPGKGTGLGLSVSHGIIQVHHGLIEVKSIPDKGSTFTVKLPAEPTKAVNENKTYAALGTSK